MYGDLSAVATLLPSSSRLYIVAQRNKYFQCVFASYELSFSLYAMGFRYPSTLAWIDPITWTDFMLPIEKQELAATVWIDEILIKSHSCVFGERI